MDTQNISNIRQLLDLHTGLRPEDVQRIQNGTFEDIHDALYEIQKRLPKNIYLDIDNLTADAQKLYPGVPLDEKEQFEAEQRQTDMPDWGDAAILASAPLAFLRTSKESELTHAYDVEKKEDVNKEIKDILAIKDTDTKEKKVRALLESLQREELYKDRKTKLIEQLKDSKRGEELIKRVENRYNELEKERRKPIDRGSSLQDRASTPTASNTAYTAYLDRLMKITLSNMSNDQLEKFLKEYANKQLRGTHIDFQKLFWEERKRLKFLGNKNLVSVRDQNKIWKKKKEEINPIVKKWEQEGKKVREEAREKYKKQKDAELAELGRLRYFLTHIIGLRRRSPQQYVTITGTVTLSEESEYREPSSGSSFIDGLNKVNDFIQDGRKFGNLLKKLNMPGGSGGAAAGSSESAVAAGGSGAGIPIAIAVGVLFVIIIVVVIISGGDGATNSTLSGSGQSLCPQETPASIQDAETTLKQVFNITVTGTDTNSIYAIYNTTCKLSQYDFTGLAHFSSKENITISIVTDNNTCGEKVTSVSGGYNIDMHPCATSAGNEFLLTHEYGHIISFQNTDLYDQWCTDVYHGTVNKNFPVDDARRCTSSSPKTIPTYNCQLDYISHKEIPGPPYPQECFADMVGAFLTYKDFQDTVTQKDGTILPNNWQLMQDFPTNFPDYYNFAQVNIFGSSNPGTPVSGQPTLCSGSVVTIPSITAKKLLPLCSGGKCFGRANYCMVPHYIVIHTTWSNDKDATSLYNYFAGGSDGRGVGINFGIGPKGDVIQMAETLTDKVEVAWNVLNYQDDIGIELVHNSDYSSNSLPPAAQYEALMNLVMSLVAQYHIPVKDTTVNGITYDCNWKSNTLNRVFAPSGVYGHYQFNTPTRSDPGQSFLCSFKKDLVSRLYPTKGLQ